MKKGPVISPILFGIFGGGEIYAKYFDGNDFTFLRDCQQSLIYP